MKVIVKSLLAICLLPALSLSVSAQESTPVAVISSEMVITLDDASPLSGTYIMDISALPFENELAARKFFHSMKDNLVSCEVDYASRKATLTLMLAYANPSWGKTEWEAYLLSVSERYRGAFDYFNN